MDDAPAVKVHERPRDLADDLEGVPHRNRPTFLHELRKRLPPQPLHDDVRPGLLIHRKHPNDRRVAEGTADLFLPLEAAEEEQVGIGPGMRDLDGHRLVVGAVEGLVDGRHGPFREKSRDLEAAVQELTKFDLAVHRSGSKVRMDAAREAATRSLHGK